LTGTLYSIQINPPIPIKEDGMANASTNAQQTHKMMQGTGGVKDYLLIAMKGEIGLGLKPNMIAPGKKPGTTYVGARIRSAKVPEADRPKLAGNVVSLAFKNLTLNEAWPGITWEKMDASRASTQIGMFLRGSPDDSPQMLLDELADHKLASKMADYLIELLGEGNMVLSRDEIITWIDQTYAPAAQKIARAVAASNAIEAEIESSIGTFGMQAELMKKAYKSLPTEDGSDVPDIEDEGTDGED